tara:strand:+ start:37293 stop:39269 length:1977 start_codon:yes stop_codon:yes gene_type:complete
MAEKIKLLTTKIKENPLSEDFMKKYYLHKISGIKYVELNKIMQHNEIISFSKIQNEKSSYIFISENPNNLLEITGKKSIRGDFLNYLDDNQITKLIFRIFGSKNDNDYFLGDNYELSKIVEKNDKMITCFVFSIDQGALTIKVNTYEKYQVVLDSYEGNSYEKGKIQKKRRFSYKNNRLIFSNNGEWIKRRSKKNKSKRNIRKLASTKAVEKETKMDYLSTFLNDLDYAKLNFFNFESKEFSLYQKNNYWKKKKESYDLEINEFLENNIIKVIDETTSKDALEKIKEKYNGETIPNSIRIILNGLENVEDSPYKIFLINNDKHFIFTSNIDNYEKLKKENPYSQMITIEQLLSMKDKAIETLFSNAIKELLIKDNIKNRKMNYFDNGIDYVYYKAIEREDNEYDLVIKTKVSDSLNFEKTDLESIIFEQPELNDFLSENDKEMESIEGVCLIKNKYYIIERTNKAVLPNYEKLTKEKTEVYNQLSSIIKKEDMKKIHDNLEKEYMNAKEGSKSKQKALNDLSVFKDCYKILHNQKHSFYTAKELLNKDNSKFIKLLKSRLKKDLGFKTMPSLKTEKNFAENAYASFVYIWFNGNEYYSGDAASANAEYDKFNYIYSVSYSDIDSDFLSLIDNVYVKHQGIANKPFPDKYLNEYYKNIK